MLRKFGANRCAILTPVCVAMVTVRGYKRYEQVQEHKAEARSSSAKAHVAKLGKCVLLLCNS
jgi:hypothetical protein